MKSAEYVNEFFDIKLMKDVMEMNLLKYGNLMKDIWR